MTNATHAPFEKGFNGFTLPDGAWLPPELLYLLPTLSYAQLKVTIAAIYHHAQVGGSEPLTLNDFEDMTGMTRSPIVKALTWLLGDNDDGLQVLERIPIDRTYAYQPRMDLQQSRLTRLSSKDESTYSTLNLPESLLTRLSEGQALRESERELILKAFKDLKIKAFKDLKLNSLSDSLDLTTSSGEKTDEAEDLAGRLALLRELRAAGVYLKTAQRLVEKYPEAHIREKMAYFQYALKTGFANGPGWLDTAIKENFPPPLGYTEQPQSRVPQICQQCFSHPCRCEVLEEVEDDFETPFYDGSAKALKAWQSALAQLKLEMPPAAFETWVAPAWLSDYDEATAEFLVAHRTEYGRDWLESRLTSQLTRALTGLMSETVQVKFVVLA